MIVLKSPANISPSDRELIKDIFKVAPGESEFANTEMQKLREDNSRLYFEIS
jgi:hypothetical protein